MQSRFRALQRALASGMGISSIFHAVLLVILTIVTLKLPKPPANLELTANATPSATDVVEMSQSAQFESAVEESPSELPPTSLNESNSELPDLSQAGISTWLERPAATSANSLPSSLAASSAASTASAIGKANASFFGSSAQGNSFCYVVDSSGSMRGGAWEAAKKELMRSISSLTDKQRFYVVFFAEEFHAIPEIGQRDPSPYLLRADRENIHHARRWIDTIQIQRGAPPNEALQFAISREPDAIYLLTDGVTKSDVLGFLQRINRTNDLIVGQRAIVPIHTIAFYSLDGQQLLRQIASENGGQFMYVPDPRKR